MSLKNYSNLYDNIYHYLGYHNIYKNNDIDLLIDECLEEIEGLESFIYRYQEFNYLLEFLNKEPYLSYLNGSDKYIISIMTLGSQVDKRINYYSKINISKMLVFDACASAYLEYRSDEYEKSIDLNLGYRFCPGYQGSSIEDIKYIFDILKPEGLGINLLESNLMTPQKTMAGIVCCNNNKRDCGNCINKKNCEYLKVGRKCYN